MSDKIEKIRKLATVLLAVLLLAVLGVAMFMDDGSLESVLASAGTQVTQSTQASESESNTANPTVYSITINNSVEGYEYVAYQIFKGNYSGGVLTDIEWGDNIDSANFLAALKTASANSSSALYGLFDSIYSTDTEVTTTTEVTSETESQGATTEVTTEVTSTSQVSASTADDIAKILASTSFSYNSASAQAFADLAYTYITGTGTTIPYDSTNQNYAVSGIDAGYYLVVNTVIPSDNTQITTESYGDAYSIYMLRVAGAASVNPKTSVPTSSKTVDDVNDSTTEAVVTATTADYDIGDDVPFTLTAELGSGYAYFTTYSITFHDTLSDGLTFNSNSVEVTLTGVI